MDKEKVLTFVEAQTNRPLAMQLGNVSPILLFIILLVLTGGCAPANVDPAIEVARTWQAAEVYFPKKFTYVTPSKVSVRDPHPTVVYLHGCSGIKEAGISWAEILTGAGYAVVLPDSFARYYRWKNCDSGSTGLFPETFRMREEEIRYALAKLKSAPWADANNLFLMGHSEGGRAVSLWWLYGFKAAIISSNACKSGVQLPYSMPILAVSFAADPWMSGSVSCRDSFNNRDNATELILPGGRHDTSKSTEAVNAVLKFLGEHTRRKSVTDLE